jgi:hypothetical protein
VAKPFKWTFSKNDLNDPLKRLAARDPVAPAPQPAAA